MTSTVSQMFGSASSASWNGIPSSAPAAVRFSMHVRFTERVTNPSPLEPRTKSPLKREMGPSMVETRFFQS